VAFSFSIKYGIACLAAWPIFPRGAGNVSPNGHVTVFKYLDKSGRSFSGVGDYLTQDVDRGSANLNLAQAAALVSHGNGYQGRDGLFSFATHVGQLRIAVNT
jgi:hypothetical protein